MAHEFVIIRNGEQETYTDYNQIPSVFEHVVSFKPEIPPEPHTEEQHQEIEKWPERLERLMQIERNGN